MGKLLFIDSDDIETLSEALQGALERRGINFSAYGIGNDEEEDDIDPYLGIVPHESRKYDIGGCGGYVGGCGGAWASHRNYGSRGGGCGHAPYYGGCGGSHC